MRIKINFFLILEKTKPESVLKVKGKVVKEIKKRQENVELKTGKVEISIETAEILSNAKELPIPVFGEQDYPEDIRLKYRFLDLRREEMHKKYNFKIKSNFFSLGLKC